MTFEEKIKRLATLFRFRVSSWGRDPEGNAFVGGASNSKHLVWLAVDCVLWNRDKDKDSFIQWCYFFGLWVKDEGDHIHVHENQ